MHTSTLPMKTLGMLIAEEAQYLMAKRIPVPAWLRPFTLVTRRIDAQPLAALADRFQRVEAQSLAELEMQKNHEPSSERRIWPSRVMGETVRVASVAAPGLARWTAADPMVTGKKHFLSAHVLPPPVSRSVRTAEDTSEPLTIQHDKNTSEHTYRQSDESISYSQTLPVVLRERLQQTLEGPVEEARIHHDTLSDTVARHERADAVTIGRHIFFRRGQFRPFEPAGLALLTHEMVHVLSAMRPNAAWHRATTMGIQREEQEALQQEQSVLVAQKIAAAYPVSSGREASAYERRSEDGEGTRMVFQPSYSPIPTLSAQMPSFASIETAGGMTAASALLQPMSAATDRPLSTQGAYPVSAPSLAQQRRVFQRDLMQQLRTDFERGG